MTAGELYVDSTTINGRWTLRLPAYRAIRYLREPSWEIERLASMFLNIAPTDVIVDIGAESGDMSALFATWVPDGGIILVEPNPKAWPGIKLHWEINDLPMPAATYVGFCAARPGTAVASDVGRPTTPGEWPDCAHGDIDPAQGFRHLAQETDTTPSTTIDRLTAGGRVDVITIDVEGAELEVLKGARGVLEERRPLVWVSVHPQFMRHHFGQRPAELYSLMEDLDYRVTHLGDDHETHVFFEPR